MLEELLVRNPDHAGANEVLAMLTMSAQRQEDAERRLRKDEASSCGQLRLDPDR